MKNEPIDIDSYIVHYLQNTCSDDERIVVLNWLRSSEENEQHFFQLKELYDSRLRSSDQTINNNIWVHLQEQIEDNDIKPIRTKFLKKRFSEWIRYAAIILIMSMLSFLYVNHNQPQAQELQVKQIEIHNNKGVYLVTLPDSTQVWLHGGTTISYPEKFTSPTRDIQLDGEAYFKVHSDKKNPFIVHTSVATICATGTEFNVTAYSIDKIAITTLIEGAVNVCNNSDKQETEIFPGQQATANGSFLKVEATDPDLYVDWKDGIYRFKKEPFDRITLQLEKMFGIKIKVENSSLKQATFSGMFTEDHSLKEVFEIINLSNPIGYKIKGKNVLIRDLSHNHKKELPMK